MSTQTQYDIGIRRNFVTLGDRNFDPSGTVLYKAGVNNLYFNGSYYSIGQNLPFDVGGVSYSKSAVEQLRFYWDQAYITPTA